MRHRLVGTGGSRRWATLVTKRGAMLPSTTSLSASIRAERAPVSQNLRMDGHAVERLERAVEIDRVELVVGHAVGQQRDFQIDRARGDSGSMRGPGDCCYSLPRETRDRRARAGAPHPLAPRRRRARSGGAGARSARRARQRAGPFASVVWPFPRLGHHRHHRRSRLSLPRLSRRAERPRRRRDRLLARRMDRRGDGGEVHRPPRRARADRAARHQGRRPGDAGHSGHLRPAS